MSSGLTFAISYARLDDSYAADRNNGSFLEWTAIESVAEAEPAIVIRGLPFSDATLSAGTRITAADPSPIGEASRRLIGVATIDDFSNWSMLIFWCRRANGLWIAFIWALIEKGAKSACFQPYSCI